MKRDNVDTTPRRTGLAPIPELPWGSHLCIFYDSPEDLLSLLPAYLVAGIEQKEKCFVVASRELGMDRVVEALRRGVPDYDAHLASGALMLLHGEELYGPPGKFDRRIAIETWRRLIAEALAGGYGGVRGFGDETWLESHDWESFSEYEADIETALHAEPAMILCGYPIDHRTAKDLFAVARTHDVVLARLKQRWHVLESPHDDESRLLLQTQRARLQRDVLQKERELESARSKLADSNSERLRLEQALKTLQDRFNAALATTPVGVVIKRIRDDRIIEVNDAFLRKLGYQRDEVLGRTAIELAMWSEAVRLEIAERMRDLDWRVDGLEVTAATRDGRSLDLVLYTQPLEVGGDACVLITLYDQTASKRIERQLVDQQWLFAEAERLSRAGSWQCADGKLTWSPELYRLHGVTPESLEPSFDAWTALVHPADRKRFRDAIDNAMREMKSFEVEHRIVLADGAIRVLRSVGYCGRRRDDDDFRVVGYSSDITDLSETMEQLRATSRKLVDLQEESQRRLATAIHDRIGQLLTAISMNLETMRSRLGGDRSLGHRLDDSIRLVRMATDAVVNILGDLRPAGLEELGLIPVLERFCTNFSKRTAIDTTLDVDVDAGSIPAEWSTPVFRIVQEGLMNVAKHAGGARHASVRMSVEGQQPELSIEDDGVGIGLGQSSGTPSSGLGLVTTRERVAALGGSFTIGPREGGGTRLLIRLPLEERGEASRPGRVSGIY